jgi:hypothetical protein
VCFRAPAKLVPAAVFNTASFVAKVALTCNLLVAACCCYRTRDLPAAAAAISPDAPEHTGTADSAPPNPSSTTPAAPAGQQQQEASAAAKRPVAASVLRAVVRPVWGTATLPLRLLVRPSAWTAATVHVYKRLPLSACIRCHTAPTLCW